MAAFMLQNSGRLCNLLSKTDSSYFLQQIRTKIARKHRGLPPEVARTWKERKEGINKFHKLDVTLRL